MTATGTGAGVNVLRDAWRTLVPDLGSRHGPLPPLMIGLTVVSGLVDAFSYVILGHVFVANMTGNVVFVAFGIAGARASRSRPRRWRWRRSSSGEWRAAGSRTAERRTAAGC